MLYANQNPAKKNAPMLYAHRDHHDHAAPMLYAFLPQQVKKTHHPTS